MQVFGSLSIFILLDSLFALATEDERELWVTEIRNAKAALLASLSMMDTNSTFTSSQATTHLRRVLQALPDENDSDSQKRSRVEHFLPAVWVPDSKTDNCMRCKAKFAWRRRRHHCRLCGRCVCADCSTKVRNGVSIAKRLVDI